MKWRKHLRAIQKLIEGLIHYRRFSGLNAEFTGNIWVRLSDGYWWGEIEVISEGTRIRTYLLRFDSYDEASSAQLKIVEYFKKTGILE